MCGCMLHMDLWWVSQFLWCTDHWRVCTVDFSCSLLSPCPLRTVEGSKDHTNGVLNHRPPPPLRSSSASSGEWSRCHNAPLQLPLPCKQWCQCRHPEPSCRLLSSPVLRTALAAHPGAPNNAARRR